MLASPSLPFLVIVASPGAIGGSPATEDPCSGSRVVLKGAVGAPGTDGGTGGAGGAGAAEVDEDVETRWWPGIERVDKGFFS